MVLIFEGSNALLTINKALSIASFFNTRMRIIYYGQSYNKCEFLSQRDVLNMAKMQNKMIHPTLEYIEKIDIVSWVEEQCKLKYYDVIVKCGHRSESFLHTPTDWQFFRKVSYPLYITTSCLKVTGRSILVAVDLQAKTKEKLALNHQVLRVARILAERLEHELHLCSIIRSTHSKHSHVNITDLKPYEIRCLEKLITTHNIDSENVHVIRGIPYHSIAYIADKLSSQCIVIGFLHKTALEDKVLGHTAEKVIHIAKRDLLAVNYRSPSSQDCSEFLSQSHLSYS